MSKQLVVLPTRRTRLRAPLAGTALLGACVGIDPIATCPNDRCADSTRFGYTALLVLGPDSTTVPACTSLRDAASGEDLWPTDVDGRVQGENRVFSLLC